MSEMEYERDTITLMDDQGQEHEFEIVDALEQDGREYLALVPIFDQPEESLEDSGELVILRVQPAEDEDGEYLEPIEDEEEFTKIADIFMERLEEFFDFDA